MRKATFTTDIPGEDGFVFRIKAKMSHEHVRTTIYAGKKGRTFALAGTLALRHKEFESFCGVLGIDADHEWEGEVREKDYE